MTLHLYVDEEYVIYYKEGDYQKYLVLLEKVYNFLKKENFNFSFTKLNNKYKTLVIEDVPYEFQLINVLRKWAKKNKVKFDLEVRA